ncbi:hypothetical protein Ahy_A01g000426 [Arachis hypogaea]|uniref:Aminotransferase-like plant mobile domain-containing protein n=1 Tax=Arachis hypogaea TaxID=3818 RepID=A0A445EKD5_ARAHY|nr:hypothetical protein Ahy_A01g000426 [Arachis hypogaea]
MTIPLTQAVMAHQVKNDRDINRLNETTYYAGAADFNLLGARPPVAAQQAAQRKESFTLKLVWLRDHVRQMSQTNDPETLRQYARCYIMLLIKGYLMTDKSNMLVHLRWLPLLRDFAECRAFSRARLCWPGRISPYLWRLSGAYQASIHDGKAQKILSNMQRSRTMRCPL